MRIGYLITFSLVIGALCAETANEPRQLFDQFGTGWRDQWQEHRYFTRPTRYEVTKDEGRLVLHATSESAHMALVRPCELTNPSRARLSWEWKISTPLAANLVEQTRSGDDFAARICVVFDRSLIPLRTKSINYVWSAHLPVGTVYPSPYSRNVGMIVLRSGNADAGRWQRESRDVVADYSNYFGHAPPQISAFAVLVDTDNTGLKTEAWFTDLTLTTTAVIPK